jgi:ABC-2 type transport system permease protein
MIPLIRAELAKIRSVRSSLILAVAAVAFCVFWTLIGVFVFDNLPNQAALSAGARLDSIYQMAQQGYVFLLIFGIVGMAGEYRHRTVAWSFLVTPVRERVLAAKAVAYTMVGFVVAVACSLATAATAAVSLGFAGKQVFAADIPLILVGCTLSCTFYTTLGLALGALIRSQITAVVLAFVFLYYAEFLLSAFLPAVGKWLPGGAAKSLIGWQALSSGSLLPVWGGALLFTAYVAILGLAAYFLTLRRDVT